MSEYDETSSSADRSEAWLGASSYWKPSHITISAWWGHAPFAFWLIDSLRPRSIVELGTHFGFSYFVFCEAAVRLGLHTRAYALDTWKGDDQAGIYGEEVFESVSAINNSDYSSFSTLLRGYFDDFLSTIADGSVDLLHIDGRHGFDDVTHDFKVWLPKLSNRGVVIFHDIAERQEGFGVWRFWETVKKQYPSFEFVHSHGLGVLGVGSEMPLTMQTFFTTAAQSSDQVRLVYERLGVEIEQLAKLRDQAQRTEALAREVAVTEEVLRQVQTEFGDARTRFELAEAEVAGLRQQLLALQSSMSWTVTRPLRAISARLKSPSRDERDPQ